MKHNGVNIMKPLIIFISPNATTRSLAQEFLRENWTGEFKVFYVPFFNRVSDFFSIEL